MMHEGTDEIKDILSYNPSHSHEESPEEPFYSFLHYALPRPTADLPLCLLFQILAALVLAAFKDIPLATKASLIFSYPAGISSIPY